MTSIPEIPENIRVGDRTIPLIVRFRRKTRHLRLRLNYKNQIAVSVPWHYSSRDVLSFIDRQYSWIEKKLAFIPETSSINDWLRKHPFLSANGRRFPIHVESVDCLEADYQFEVNYTKLLLRISKNDTNFEKALLKLLRIFSKDVLAWRVNYHARRLNLKFERLTVRDQASRWGSCSNKKNISLNWRLILIEPKLQDYIILHELAHLTEMNHSRRFWNLLESYDPLRQEHESALKKITGTIMRVGRY